MLEIVLAAGLRDQAVFMSSGQLKEVRQDLLKLAEAADEDRLREALKAAAEDADRWASFAEEEEEGA